MYRLTFSLEGYTLGDIFDAEFIKYDDYRFEHNYIDFVSELTRSVLSESFFEVVENHFGNVLEVHMCYRVADLGDGVFELIDQGFLLLTLDDGLKRLRSDEFTNNMVSIAHEGLQRLRNYGYKEISSEL